MIRNYRLRAGYFPKNSKSIHPQKLTSYKNLKTNSIDVSSNYSYLVGKIDNVLNKGYDFVIIEEVRQIKIFRKH